MRTFLALIVLLLAYAVPAQAQTGPCPTPLTVVIVTSSSPWVCMVAPSDYNTTDPNPDGTATTVRRYVRVDLLLFAPTVTDTATGAATTTVDFGLPATNADNAIWAQVPALGLIPRGQLWKARAVSVGQPAQVGGTAQVSGRSPESNPFTRPLPPFPAPSAPPSIRVLGS